MINVALEVAEYLEDNSIGTVGVDIFVDFLPDDDNNVIAIYNTGGETPDIDIPVGNPTFEVLVRNESTATAYSKITSIVNLLHQKYNLELIADGNYYYYILLTGEINLLGKDEKQRSEYSANFRTQTRGR